MADLFLLMALVVFVAGVFLTWGLGPGLIAAAVPLAFVGSALADGKGIKWRS